MPIVARIAKEQGATVVCIVTTSFHVERARRLLAEKELENLREWADTLIVIDKDKLMEDSSNLPLGYAFSVIDEIIADTIKGTAGTLTQPSLINIDYADVKTIMSCGGASYILVGEGNIRDSPQKVIHSVLKNPLLDVDYRGATGCLLHMTGGFDLTLKDAATIASALTQELDPRANIIWGARILPGFDGKIRLMAILTGVRQPRFWSRLRRLKRLTR